MGVIGPDFRLYDLGDDSTVYLRDSLRGTEWNCHGDRLRQTGVLFV